MFERFTRGAREVVASAQLVARETASRTIDTRHLLVALSEGAGPEANALHAAGLDVETFTTALRAELAAGGLDPEALASVGIDLDDIRERADGIFGPGSLDGAGRSPGHIPFTRDAKKSLELALREAVRLKDKSISARHLLLGVLRAECPGRDRLVVRHVDLDGLRRMLEEPNRPEARSA